MGFFDKVKQWLGIGGVKFELQVQPQYPKDGGNVGGKLLVTSKSDQHIAKITVKVVETWKTGTGQNATSKDYDLGEVQVSGDMDIKAGESKAFDFTCAYTRSKSMAEGMADKGGAMGALGKVAMFASGEKSTYWVKAVGDVKGTAFGPAAVKQIKLA